MNATSVDAATRRLPRQAVGRKANPAQRTGRFSGWLRAVAVGGLALSTLAPAAAAPLMDQADATRLLEQTTFGPTDALVAHVQAEGVMGWLNEQFAAPESRYPVFPYVPQDG